MKRIREIVLLLLLSFSNQAYSCNCNFLTWMLGGIGIGAVLLVSGGGVYGHSKTLSELLVCPDKIICCQAEIKNNTVVYDHCGFTSNKVDDCSGEDLRPFCLDSGGRSNPSIVPNPQVESERSTAIGLFWAGGLVTGTFGFF